MSRTGSRSESVAPLDSQDSPGASRSEKMKSWLAGIPRAYEWGDGAMSTYTLLAVPFSTLSGLVRFAQPAMSTATAKTTLKAMDGDRTAFLRRTW